MLAVIKTGGKQYKVKEGQTLKIEKIIAEVGNEVNFPEVLLMADDLGDNLKIGNPLVVGAKVVGHVLKQSLAKKISVVHYRSKVRYTKRVGHRQPFTEIKITQIV